MSTPSSTERAREMRTSFDTSLFDDQAAKLAAESVARFRVITRGYALFHIGFFALGLAEVLSLLLFLPFLAKSSFFAIPVAAMFLTAFSYFVLRFYFQTKKPEQFLAIKDDFFQRLGEGRIAAIRGAHALLAGLEGQEYQYYQMPASFDSIAPVMEKFSLWCHWQDVHLMKELLHHVCVQEHVELIKLEPTNLEVHASLAGSYTSLYRLYMDPRKLGKHLPYPFISKEYADPAMVEKLQEASGRAIEELKILDVYSPNDPWVHTQLAAIYHDLELPEKEITEYETVLRMAPQDRAILFRLGVLYFQQGRNAQGLKAYEELKRARDPKAEELIGFYEA